MTVGGAVIYSSSLVPWQVLDDLLIYAALRTDEKPRISQDKRQLLI
jgi:hypothetical protein